MDRDGGVCEDVPMFVRRNVTVTAVVGALALSACGASSGGDAAQVPGAAATEATPTTDTAEALSPTPTEAEPAAPPATEAPVAEEAPAASVVPAPAPVVTESPATAVPITDPPANVPPPAEVGGRAFAAMLAPSSDVATNPLPDLLVDDIRGGSKINLRNVFPADRPVLIWMWAPH